MSRSARRKSNRMPPARSARILENILRERSFSSILNRY
jgi:hypothetical protein